MPRYSNSFLQTPFLIPATIGSLLFGLASLLPATAQLAILGISTSVILGLMFTLLEEQSKGRELFLTLTNLTQIPEAVAEDAEYLEIYRSITAALVELHAQRDPVLREVARTRLLEMGLEIEAMGDGQIVFHETESWRTVYDALLKTVDLQVYRSVAWVQTPNYWQDTPGRQSMQANYNAILNGLVIERVCILPDALWGAGQTPQEEVLLWLMQQHEHGVWLLLARESEVDRETGLPDDFGIYGSRAVGYHLMDAKSRTIRFRIHFDEEEVQLANQKWQRLLVHATPMDDLLGAAE